MGIRTLNRVLDKAEQTAGYRERFAMANGKRKAVRCGGIIFFVWNYSKDLEYQDANGATFDTTHMVWVA